ncbi:MAG: Dot/Icm secretion system protein IcmQ [Legionella sp.]|nr:MAG: Dot/Icm secretion system protein IcmQ [Legionella sp.]PJE00107.1 MAG: Dot/Icm secretion system protein IcmQ [Legionella sp.]
MTEKLNDEQNAELLKALNKAIAEGPWEQSNFLKSIGKNMIAIRDEVLVRLGSSPEAQLKAESLRANQLALRSTQQEIFISLYCYEGSNLQNWEKIVSNLPGQMISRPVYAREMDIKDMLKYKENKQNEAYVVIYVDKANILPLPPDKIIKDKQGIALLTLKDKSVSLNNIIRFEHSSGTYEYVKGHLLKVPS